MHQVLKLQLVEPEKEGKVISSNRLGEKGMRRSELLGQRKYETGSNHQIQSQWSLSEKKLGHQRGQVFEIHLRGVPGWCLNWMKSGRAEIPGQLSSVGVPSA